MAGERLAKLTVRACLADSNGIFYNQTAEIRFRLAGMWETFVRDGRRQPNQFLAQPKSILGPDYAKLSVLDLVLVMRQTIARRGLPYVVSDPREAGFDVTTGWPQVDFDVTATTFTEPGLDLDFYAAYPGPPTSGWQVLLNQPTIGPVRATALALPATIYGSATGSIYVTVYGSNGACTFEWADDPTGPSRDTRLHVVAGTYACTVRDAMGASAVVTAVVVSDPQLVVQVNVRDTGAELVPSGGLPPYAFAWADGPTTATRTGLGPGTYLCTVRDARGATQLVTVTLSVYRYYWSQNPVTLALDAGAAYRADPSTKPNLSFLCEVWLEREYLSGDFTQVGTTLEQPADRAGRTVFEVQALLAGFLQPHVPAVEAVAAEQATPLFRRFYLRHAEQYGAVPAPVPYVTLERNYVVLGGLGFYEAQARTWFTSYQPQPLPVLTWEPARKSVLADQPEYLYYMVQGEPGGFAYRARVYFSDGTEQVLTYAGAAAVRAFEVYCLPVGYLALGLASLATASRQVRWWEVFVTTPDGGQVLSETRRFVLDSRTFPHRRYFLFATSLGGMATYAALGEAQLDLEVTGEEATWALPPDYDPLAGDAAVLARALRPVLKVAAGKRTQAQLQASQDLLLSKRVLLLSGSRWVPGFLKAKNVTLLDEGKLVQTQEFEFTLPTERLHTPDL